MVEERLVKMGTVIGSDLHDAQGGKLATIREIFMDAARGVNRFAICEVGGLLGTGGKFHPVPWSKLRYDADKNALTLAVTKAQLKDAPAFDRDQLNGASTYGWSETVERYFTTLPA